MSSSAVHGTAQTSGLLSRLAASPQALRAAGLGALATVLLLVKWTLLVPVLYESQAVLEIQVAGSTAQRAQLHALVAAEDRAGRQRKVQTEAISVDAHHVGLACRGVSAHAAYQACGALVTRALAQGAAYRVARPATLPSKPLPFQNGWAIWLVSCGVGITAALVWLGAATLWERRRKPAIGAAPHGPQPLAGRATIPGAAEPRASAVPGERPSAAGHAPAGSAAEQLSSLRDRLYLLAADSCFVVGVSGRRDEADSKAVVAAQLASALATSEEAEVLLVEADFDQPAVHIVMDVTMPSLAGFSQQIHQRLTATSKRPWTVVRGAPCLSVLAEGLVRTPGMMYSGQFVSAIQELRNAYDIIVLSGPAVSGGTDLQAFSDVVDGVVYVMTPGEDGAAAHKLAGQLFRNKRFVTVVSGPERDER